jgi:hypothetical protein
MSEFYTIDDLEDFDLILFNGKGFWFSYLVEYATWSNYSHIGVFLKGAEEIKNGLREIPLLFESGREPYPDEVEHEIKFGTQISNFRKILQNYDGNIFCRKLQITHKERKKLKERLVDIYESVKDHPYDDNPLDLLQVEFDIDIGNCQRTNSYFCSALVTYIYVKLGLLPITEKWDLIKPSNFADSYIDKQLLQHFKLGEIREIR